MQIFKPMQTTVAKLSVFFLLLLLLGPKLQAQDIHQPAAKAVGPYGNISLGVLRGGIPYYGTQGSVHGEVGIRLFQRYEVGAGVGIDGYGDMELIPIYAVFRANILKKRTTPYVTGKVGGSFLWKRNGGPICIEGCDFEGGATAGIDLGVRREFSKHVAGFLSGGYRWQEITYSYSFGGPGFQRDNYWNGMLELRFGLSFH